MPDLSSYENNSTSEIRQLKRAQRQLLSAKVQSQHAHSMYLQLIRQHSYKNCRHLALYLANDGEIDPTEVIEHAWSQGKTVYLPILSPLKQSLYFAPYQFDSMLTLNRYNIPEPDCHPSQWKTAAQLDLLLLPLVAFDARGNRIGMGGGYYDRTLSYLRHRQYWKKPKLVGLAHEIQNVGQLSANNWDIPLNYILTEKQLYHCS